MADLNWGRSAPWRELFARTFNSEKHFSALANAKEIQITYNAHSTRDFHHSKIQSTYFQGWLASKLAWNFNGYLGGIEESSFLYKSDKGPVSIILTPKENSHLPSGRILQIDLLSRNHTHVSCKRMHNHLHKVSIERSTPSLCQMPAFFLLDKESSGQSLTHEIYNKGTNETFLNVLHSLSNLREEALLS